MVVHGYAGKSVGVLMFDRARLIATLESPEAENFRTLIYDDATGKLIRPGSVVVGSPTWGIGWNISAYPLSLDRARIMCGWQLDDTWAELIRTLPWVSDLDTPRTNALMEMAFNMGVPELLGFKNMLAALREKRWLDASDEALNSEWAKEVGVRADRIAKVFATGADK